MEKKEPRYRKRMRKTHRLRSSSVDQAGCVRETSDGSSGPTGLTKPSEKDKGLN